MAVDDINLGVLCYLAINNWNRDDVNCLLEVINKQKVKN